MKKEDIKNKYYDEFEISTKSREKITKGVIEDLKNIPTTSIANMDDWRNEKMKKEKTYLDVVKKISVAALSLCATGAIIFGVTKYNENNKDRDVNVSKDTIATERNTTVTEKDTENNTENNKENNKVDVKEGDYVKIFKDCPSSLWSTSFSSASNNDEYIKVTQVEVGDYTYEACRNYDDDNMWLSVIKNDDSECIQVRNMTFNDPNTVFSDGKNILTMNNNQLYIYDIKTRTLEEINIQKLLLDNKLAVKKDFKEIYSDYCCMHIVAIKSGEVYILDPDKSIMSYDINSKAISMVKENIVEAKTSKTEYMPIVYMNADDIPVFALWNIEGKVIDEDLSKTESRPFIEIKDNKVNYFKESKSKFEFYSYDMENGKNNKLGEMKFDKKELEDKYGKGAWVEVNSIMDEKAIFNIYSVENDRTVSYSESYDEMN